MEVYVVKEVKDVVDTSALMESDGEAVKNESKAEGENVICNDFTTGISLRLTSNDK